MRGEISCIVICYTHAHTTRVYQCRTLHTAKSHKIGVKPNKFLYADDIRHFLVEIEKVDIQKCRNLVSALQSAASCVPVMASIAKTFEYHFVALTHSVSVSKTDKLLSCFNNIQNI